MRFVTKIKSHFKKDGSKTKVAACIARITPAAIIPCLAISAWALMASPSEHGGNDSPDIATSSDTVKAHVETVLDFEAEVKTNATAANVMRIGRDAESTRESNPSGSESANTAVSSGIKKDTNGEKKNTHWINIPRNNIQDSINTTGNNMGVTDEDDEGQESRRKMLYRDRKGLRLKLGKSGNFTKGFIVVNGRQYYFGRDGYALSGWIKTHSRTYYFDRKTCIRRQGWIYDEGGWYYLNGTDLYKGWHEIKGTDEEVCWYCFDNDGLMYEDCETPDGYMVDSDGRRIDEDESKEDGGSWDAGEDRETFGWNKDKSSVGTLSGLEIAGHPAELYMLSTAGETGGFASNESVVAGDRGRAYGICQFDYRYDLVRFMNEAYSKHPKLWAGFKPYLGLRDGDPSMIYNDGIGNAFLYALENDFETAVSDQLDSFAKLYWDGTENALNAAGFNLGERHIAVSAALFSVNVNCGPHNALYIECLDPDMTDEEMIRAIYRLRNTVMANEMVGSRRKGTGTRYLSAEPQMALDLLYGYVTIDSHIVYGGGVEWHGNPFSGRTSTTPGTRRISYLDGEFGAEGLESMEYDDGTAGTDEDSTEGMDDADDTEDAGDIAEENDTGDTDTETSMSNAELNEPNEIDDTNNFTDSNGTSGSGLAGPGLEISANQGNIGNTGNTGITGRAGTWEGENSAGNSMQNSASGSFGENIGEAGERETIDDSAYIPYGPGISIGDAESAA